MSKLIEDDAINDVLIYCALNRASKTTIGAGPVAIGRSLKKWVKAGALDLKNLLSQNDFTFAHDIVGILSHNISDYRKGVFIPRS